MNRTLAKKLFGNVEFLTDNSMELTKSFAVRTDAEAFVERVKTLLLTVGVALFDARLFWDDGAKLATVAVRVNFNNGRNA